MDELSFYSQFVTPRRLQLIHDKAELRTRFITIVIEDVYQTHNASAILRTCDCFGIQDVYFIENQNKYEISSQVALGASQWLNVNRIDVNAESDMDLIHRFRSKGYRIVATTPHANSINLEDFDTETSPFVLFFGTELTGLSNYFIENADVRLKIPMVGFTESLNISVSAGIFLHHLSSRLRSSNQQIGLSEEEKRLLKVQWLKNSVKRPELLEKTFTESYR
jgi:tRNA (guanosine-2'-O-)-methyltransferase